MAKKKITFDLQKGIAGLKEDVKKKPKQVLKQIPNAAMLLAGAGTGAAAAKGVGAMLKFIGKGAAKKTAKKVAKKTAKRVARKAVKNARPKGYTESSINKRLRLYEEEARRAAKKRASQKRP